MRIVVIHWEEIEDQVRVLHPEEFISKDATDAELEKFDNDLSGLTGEERSDHPDCGWKLVKVTRGDNIATLEYTCGLQAATTIIWAHGSKRVASKPSSFPSIWGN